MPKETEVKCSCKFVASKVVFISGIVAGALLTILGIVTITGDTKDLFRTPFLRWYTPETFRITFSDTSGLNYRDVWQRPHEKLRWEWTSKSPRSILETDANYEPLPDGIRTEELTNGGVTVSLNKLTIQTHYYCVTRDKDHCRPEDQYHGRIHMFTASVFRSANVLGNQNYRWTFFVLAALAVVFGITMILGELHVAAITTKFTFFYYGFVKGIIYILVGMLCFGMSNLFGLFVAIVMIAVGVLNCVFGFRGVRSFQWNTIGSRGTTTIVTRREYI